MFEFLVAVLRCGAREKRPMSAPFACRGRQAWFARAWPFEGRRTGRHWQTAISSEAAAVHLTGADGALVNELFRDAGRRGLLLALSLSAPFVCGGNDIFKMGQRP